MCPDDVGRSSHRQRLYAKRHRRLAPYTARYMPWPSPDPHIRPVFARAECPPPTVMAAAMTLAVRRQRLDTVVYARDLACTHASGMVRPSATRPRKA